MILLTQQKIGASQNVSHNLKSELIQENKSESSGGVTKYSDSSTLPDQLSASAKVTFCLENYSYLVSLYT